MRNFHKTSRVIPFDDAPSCERWQAPTVSDLSAEAHPDTHSPLLTDDELDQIRERARAEGFEFGRREGLEAGAVELTARAARLEQIIDALEAPVEALDAEVEEQLLALAKALTRQLIRRELRSEPAQVIGVIREALAALPASARGVRVYLHPEDAAVVQATLAGDDAGRAWRIEQDPVMERGGCRVTTRTSDVDGSLDGRLNRLIAGLLGCERAGDD